MRSLATHMILSGLVKAPKEAWQLIAREARNYEPEPGTDCLSKIDWPSILHRATQAPTESEPEPVDYWIPPQKKNANESYQADYNIN